MNRETSQLLNKVVFVDVDNTLADLNTELKEKGYRTDIYPSPIPESVFTYIFYALAYPILLVIEHVISLYKKGDEIVYITARLPEFDSVTKQWLRRHGLPKGTLIHTHGKPKGPLVKEMGYKVIAAIDDSPLEIRSYVETFPDIEMYIPEWEYNTHIEGIKIPVCKKLAEV